MGSNGCRRILSPGALRVLRLNSRGYARTEGEKNPESDYINQMSQGQRATYQIEESGAEANPHSDRELVAEVLAKDRKATAEFVARYADHVYGYVRRRLIPHTDLVDDLVQEIFLAA